MSRTSQMTLSEPRKSLGAVGTHVNDAVQPARCDATPGRADTAFVGIAQGWDAGSAAAGRNGYSQIQTL